MWRAREHGATISKANRGRGLLPTPSRGAYRSPVKGKEGHDPLALRQLRNVKGACLEAIVQFERWGEVQVPLASKLCRRLKELGIWQDDVPDLSGESLQHAHAVVAELVTALQKKIQNERIERWRSSIQADPSLKKSFAYVTNKRLTSLSSVRKPDGSIPTSEREFFDTLMQFWGPIFSPKDQMSAPDLSALVDYKYSEWWAADGNIGDVTHTMLADAAASMKLSSSPGPGGWRVAEVRALPQQAWVEMMFLIHIYEKEGFPEAMQEVWISLIPKSQLEEHPAPGDLRPIAVASSLYRVYSRAKARALSNTVESFLHPSQWGARPQRSLHQAVASVATRLEQAPITHKHWHGFSLDFQKCFDSMPSSAIASVLMIAGVDTFNAELVQRIVQSMKRRWRMPGRTLSPLLDVTRGIPQGCSLSVLVANVFIASLSRSSTS